MVLLFVFCFSFFGNKWGNQRGKCSNCFYCFARSKLHCLQPPRFFFFFFFFFFFSTTSSCHYGSSTLVLWNLRKTKHLGASVADGILFLLVVVLFIDPSRSRRCPVGEGILPLYTHSYPASVVLLAHYDCRSCSFIACALPAIISQWLSNSKLQDQKTVVFCCCCLAKNIALVSRMPPHQGERSRTAFFSFSDKPYYPSPVVTIIINEKPRSSVSALPRPLQPSASGWILQGCNNHKHIYTRRHTIEHGKKKNSALIMQPS